MSCPVIQTVHRAWTEVLDQHVHPIDQPQAQFDALRLLQVDTDPALAPIQTEEKVRLSARKWRPPAPPHIARARLQLIHLRAIIAQQQRAVGASQSMRKIEHAYTVQRLHRSVSIHMRSSAVLNVFPCGSARNEIVPPPSRAS